MEVQGGEVEIWGTIEVSYTYIGQIFSEMNMYYLGEKIATVQRNKELKENSWYEIVFHKTNLSLEVVSDIVYAYSFIYCCRKG